METCSAQNKQACYPLQDGFRDGTSFHPLCFYTLGGHPVTERLWLEKYIAYLDVYYLYGQTATAFED